MSRSRDEIVLFIEVYAVFMYVQKHRYFGGYMFSYINDVVIQSLKSMKFGLVKLAEVSHMTDTLSSETITIE
jgi:hypothetical protein